MEDLQHAYLEALTALGKAENHLLRMVAEVNVTTALTKINAIHQSMKNAVSALFQSMRLSEEKMKELKTELLAAGCALSRIDR